MYVRFRNGNLHPKRTIPGYEKSRLSEPYWSRVLNDQLIVKVLVEKCQAWNLLSHWIRSGSGEWKVPPPTGGPTGKVLSHWLFPLESAKLDDDWSNSLASSSTPVVQQPAIFAGNSLSNGIITLFDQ